MLKVKQKIQQFAVSYMFGFKTHKYIIKTG